MGVGRGRGAGDPPAEAAASGGWLEAEARAKVNLRLRIFPPARDGYHPIETIFCRLDLADRVRLRLRAEAGVELVLGGGEPAPVGSDNLAVQAADRFLTELAAGGGTVIELEKHIPAAAGLGGGSSDAAAILRTLARTRGGGTRDDLLRIAAGLGADVPFFVSNVPLALAWGRGDRLFTLPPPPPRPLLLLVPEERISTAAAYASWDERSARGAREAEAAAFDGQQLRDWEGIATLAVNDFEGTVFEMAPRLRELKQRLLETGAEFALLSGSGSTVFGVYDEIAARETAAASLSALSGVRAFTASGPV